MKKKLVIMAVLLSAICFTGFAQEAFNSEAPRYIAKETKAKEKEYTFIVSGQVKIDGEWVLKREKFVIIDKSLFDAEKRARDKFSILYTGRTVSAAPYGSIKSVVVTCESVKENVCEL